MGEHKLRQRISKIIKIYTFLLSCYNVFNMHTIFLEVILTCRLLSYITRDCDSQSLGRNQGSDLLLNSLGDSKGNLKTPA